MKKHIIAIDIGTQSSRAAVVTQEGDILGIHQIAHDLDSPNPNWAQQRAEASADCGASGEPGTVDRGESSKK